MYNQDILSLLLTLVQDHSKRFQIFRFTQMKIGIALDLGYVVQKRSSLAFFVFFTMSLSFSLSLSLFSYLSFALAYSVENLIFD